MNIRTHLNIKRNKQISKWSDYLLQPYYELIAVEILHLLLLRRNKNRLVEMLIKTGNVIAIVVLIIEAKH